MSSHRILVIDDNAAIHDDYRKVLAPAKQAAELDSLEASIFGESAAADAAGYEIDSALQGQEGAEKLRKAVAEGRPYSMAFVDMRMPPGWDGVQTIQELWKIDPHLQVVICTAYSDYSPEQISQRLGSTNQMLILRKPFDHIEIRQLAATMTAKAEVRQQREDLEKLVAERTAELRRVALHDGLTGLPNRALFNDRLERSIKRAMREKDYLFAVLFVDCDRFKVVNDSLGHAAGDQLLLEIAHRLDDALREVDTVARADEGDDSGVAARLGGDEFALLLDRVRSDADAVRVAQRLAEALSKPYVINGNDILTTASIGITTSSLNYRSADEMVRDADTAMYRAKAAGGSSCVMFDEKMHIQAVARLALESDLRRAIERQEIYINYQPIVCMRTGNLDGFEALARWKHPQRGIISPAEFIPVAEETGSIIPLGFYMLENACRQLAEWKRLPGCEKLTMSVNLSRKQLSAQDLTARIERILKETGVRPQDLKLEITESTVMDDADTAVRVLEQIRQMNVQLHMDDFGTGYSSLSCLHNFPIDGLKIDRDFVSGITTHPDRAAVVKAVITMAHNLQIPLVAEGIETPEQVQLLQSMGCDHAQGYLFSKPMDQEHATKFIKERAAKTSAA